jgi:transcriptional regulator with XRE-family HTH domain
MAGEARAVEREKLDREQRYFRVAAKTAAYSPQWLRRVRKALGMRVREMARDLEVNPSVIFRLEKSEEKKAISLRAMEKVAAAMGCKVVYAIVPREGRTLTELAEKQRWERELGRR